MADTLRLNRAAETMQSNVQLRRNSVPVSSQSISSCPARWRSCSQGRCQNGLELNRNAHRCPWPAPVISFANINKPSALNSNSPEHTMHQNLMGLASREANSGPPRQWIFPSIITPTCQTFMPNNQQRPKTICDNLFPISPVEPRRPAAIPPTIHATNAIQIPRARLLLTG